MKAADIKVGGEYAITDSTSRYDQITRKATRAKVLTPPKAGHVEVEFLEDLNSYGWHYERSKPKKGDRRTVQTKRLWMPWHRLTARADVERSEKERIAREDEKRSDKLVALQKRIDNVPGYTGGGVIQWARRAGISSDESTLFVKIETAVLEVILDKAEEKAS